MLSARWDRSKRQAEVRALAQDRDAVQYVQRLTGRDNLEIWLGECHVHAAISPSGAR